MVEQVTFQTIFQFLQTVGILVGVFYYVLTIRANQRNQELARKAQEQALETRQTQLFMYFHEKLVEKYDIGLFANALIGILNTRKKVTIKKLEQTV